MPNRYSKNRPGSGLRDRGNREAYVNPNPSNNRRGSGVRNKTSTYRPDSNNTNNQINNNQSVKRSARDTFNGDKTVSSTGIFLSYPIARTPSERTGDTLLIKCIEYVPPKGGAGLDLKVDNTFAYNKQTGKYSVVSPSMRKNEFLSNKERNPFYNTKPTITSNLISGNQRMREQQKVKYYVELPAPQEVNDSNSVTWGEDTLNALELAALNVARGAMEANPENGIAAAQAAVQALQTGVDFGDTLGGDVSSAVRAAISGAAVGALGGNVSAQSVIARSTGQILNSNTELLFQGVNLRSFPFSITFTPRDPNEAKVVKAIIRSFKQSMAAKASEFNGSSATGLFLKSPDVFSLRYKRDGADHPFLNAFKLCALTAMSVNYTNAGTYASYDDGTPVAIRLNMTFKEINPIYNEDYLQPEAGDGVGY